ncbi:MAG: hypothetical protein KAI47_13070 [Deltaproteobacteria bacterium]|nr:hypothetical protein [Deltaproteobacteria bacterium]
MTSMLPKMSKSPRDERLIELFRLRYLLREAAATGRRGPDVTRALARLHQLAQGRGALLFEYRRWVVQLDHKPSEAA